MAARTIRRALLNSSCAKLIVVPLFTVAAHAAVNISAHRTKNMACSHGVCAPTDKNAYLNTDQLAKMLANSNVEVTTANGAETIEITTPVSWASANRLTLDANCNVSIKALVTVAGTGGALTIVSNDGGSGCDLVFFPGGRIDFWDLSSGLSINGATYTLVKDIASLASAISNNSSGSYALARNIDDHGTTYTATPISTSFGGELIGLDHTISNFSISTRQSHPAAFFYAIDAGAIVRDMALTSVTVHAQKRTAAILAVTNGGTIQNVSAAGSVAGAGYVGGLVAYNTAGSLISDSIASVSVAAGVQSLTGGIAGKNDGTIIRSVVAGSVSGAGPHGCLGARGYTGGLVGANAGYIALSRANAMVNGGQGQITYDCGDTLTYAGGLAGINVGIVDRSFATGSVTVLDLGVMGGGVGENVGTITNAYSSGDVGSSEPIETGGFTGVNRAQMSSIYSLSHISNTGYDCKSGGLIGCDDAPAGNIVSSDWDLDTSGIGDASRGAGSPANDPGITGLTDSELKSGLPAGFDPAVWGQDPSINNGYPYLLANPPAK